MNVLSLFDGMSCGQQALERAGVKVDNYYASEIDKYAITVTMANYPNTKQLGSVVDVKGSDLPKIDLLLGGSPCQSFSFAGKRKGMSTKCETEILTLEHYLELKEEGYEFEGQSYLFWEYMRLLNEVKPKYFLLENVMMGKKWQSILTKAIGVEPIVINSSLVSAQNRKRLYWTNIPNIEVPKGEFVHCSNIIPNAVGGSGNRGKFKNPDGTWFRQWTTRTDGLINCLTKSSGCRYVTLTDGTRRPLTIEECEQFQGVPIGYTQTIGVTKKDRHDMLGNGWTIDVIKHFFSFIPELKNILVNQK